MRRLVFRGERRVSRALSNLLATAGCLLAISASPGMAAPGDADFFVTRGQAELEAGRMLNALDDFESALALCTNASDRSSVKPADVHAWLGDAFRAAGRLEAARRHIEQAILLDPGSPKPYLLRARLNCEAGAVDPAILDLCKGCELGGEADPELLEDIQAALAAQRDLEREFLGMKVEPAVMVPVFDEELGALARMEAADIPENREALAQIRHAGALLLMERAAETGRESDEMRAISYAGSALALSGSARDAFLLASLHMLRDDPVSDVLAERAFADASRGGGNAAKAALAQGVLRFKRGQYKEGLPPVIRAVQAEPELATADTIAMLTMAYAMAGMAQAGAGRLAWLEERSPARAECRLGQAILLMHDRRWDAAARALDGLAGVEGVQPRHTELARILRAEMQKDASP